MIFFTVSFSRFTPSRETSTLHSDGHQAGHLATNIRLKASSLRLGCCCSFNGMLGVQLGAQNVHDLDGQAIRNANRGDSRESIRRKTLFS